MRTTLDLPDDLFRQLKTAAATRGVTLKEIVTEAIVRELKSPQVDHLRRVEFPIVPSKSGRKLDVTADTLKQLDAEEDRRQMGLLNGDAY